MINTSQCIAYAVLERFLLGERLTKADVNLLIDKGVSLSPEDIFRCLRDQGVLFTYKRFSSEKGETEWFMTEEARTSFLKSPAKHKNIKFALDKQKSKRAAAKKVRTISERYGISFCFSALLEQND
ncbi:hypothetical protein [Photobacterium sp. TLY01]|uniref:hypothetical protein n=1 Tax=Photobacterium sp. TLY01 TaxID=2907534 RepID=UPI001F239F23|nr:hypothetical protein [Photobacterium sp. TLY01]UIP27774.1 hypothetical protein LN341_14495 [Photobacterium sp. TLY01]